MPPRSPPRARLPVRPQLHPAVGEGEWEDPMRLPLPPRAGSPAHVARILVIDDDPLVLDAVTEFLGSSGYQVIPANRGRAGLALARVEHPDLILLDLCLPDLDGMTVLQILRADSLTRGVPVVAITVSGDPARPRGPRSRCRATHS